MKCVLDNINGLNQYLYLDLQNIISKFVSKARF